MEKNIKRNISNQLNYIGVSFTFWTNTIIFMLSSLPIIGKSLIAPLVKKYGIKRNLSLITFIVRTSLYALIAIVKGYILIVYIPGYILKVKPEEMVTRVPLIFTLCLIILFVSDLIGVSSIMRQGSEDYMFLKLFKLNPKEYYINKFIKNTLFISLGELVLFIILFKDVKTVILLFSLSLLREAFNNWFCLKYYKANSRLIHYKLRNIYKYGIMVVILVLLYFKKLPLFNPEAINIIPFIIIFLLFLILIGTMIRYILGYEEYEAVSRVFASESSFHISISNNNFEDNTATDARDFSADKNKAFLEKNKNLSLNAYVEKVFIERLKGVIINNWKGKLMGTFTVFLLITILIKLNIFVPRKDIISYSTFILSFILSLSIAGDYCKICFRNYDMPFLFQRALRGSTLKRQILERLRIITVISIINLVFVTILLWGFLKINGLYLTPKIFKDFVVVYSALYIALEFFELCSYYLFTPYDVDLQRVSGKYKIISQLKHLIMASFIFIRTDITQSRLTVLVLLGISLILIPITLKAAEKTFTLDN